MADTNKFSASSARFFPENKKAAKYLKLSCLIWRPQGDSPTQAQAAVSLVGETLRIPARAVLAFFLTNKKAAKHLHLAALSGVPRGIRTPVPTVKGWCPRPLDDGDSNLSVLLTYLLFSLRFICFAIK